MTGKINQSKKQVYHHDKIKRIRKKKEPFCLCKQKQNGFIILQN